MDKTLEFRLDYEGNSDARQETVRDLEERARVWKFEAVIDAAQHPGTRMQETDHV
jgi:hypothetical protein